MINFWYPETLLPLVDRFARRAEQDRSKFIRTAIREKLERSGIQIPQEAA